MKKNNKKYALKEMSKVRIIDRRSEKSIKGERDFLSMLRHPFIVNMNCAFQDYENLYLVMDLLTGGDLRYHLCKIRRFSEEETKFFIACLLLGLEYIHNNNIIHRDIKPENLVSDDKGYIRITDFGVAKIRKEDNSSETSGTPGYMAPEVLMAKNHSFPVDFFAIGIMGYEFMFGQRPYIGKNRKEIKHEILQRQAKIDEDDVPEGWSLESVDFINKCMKRKESRRLGYNKGVIELKEHKWFQDFDWEGLYNKTISAPFVPKRTGNYDKKYCEGIEKISDATLERYQTYLKKKNFKNIFIGYTYINTDLIQNTETLSNITTGTKSNKVQIKTNASMNNDKINKLLNNNLPINNNNIEKKINNNDVIFDLKQIKEDDDNNNNNNNNNKSNSKQIKEDIINTYNKIKKTQEDNNINKKNKKSDNKKDIKEIDVNDNIELKEIEDNNNRKIIDIREDNNISKNKLNETKENNNKETLEHKLNCLSLSGRDKSKLLSPSNSIIIGNNKKDIDFYNRENSKFSLQKYLNYSKQNRIKFGGRTKNSFYQKGEESSNNVNEKGLNLSGLEPSTSLNNNNNFKQVIKRNEEVNKMRSSSVCFSSNNNNENSNAKIRMNKTNCLNDGGKTIDINKISRLCDLMHMTNKGSLSNKNKDKHSKINFNDNFSLFATPIGSPRNLKKGNLFLKKEFGNKTNRLNYFCLPNLLKGAGSPSFINGFKLKGQLNLNIDNLNQIKIKLSKQKNNNNIDINYKKLLNNNKINKKRPINFKRSSSTSTSMFNQFMKNNVSKNGICQRKNNNFENRSGFEISGNKSYYSNIKKKKESYNSQ